MDNQNLRNQQSDFLNSPIAIEISIEEENSYSFSVRSDEGTLSSSWVMNWDMGDGTTINQHTPKHTYAEPGNYAIKVKAALIEETEPANSYPEGFLDPHDEKPIEITQSLRVE